MYFRDFLTQLELDRPVVCHNVRSRLHSLEHDSSTDRETIRNLMSEHGFFADDWNALCVALNDVPRIPVAVRRVIQEFCRKGRSLQGTPANVPESTIMGKLARWEGYGDVLIDAGIHCSRALVDAALRRVIGVPPSRLTPQEALWPMGRHIQWSTFDPVHANEPFGLPEPPLDHLICSLGMEPNSEEVNHDACPWLLFQYLHPNDCPIRVPTFCDAYAGEHWPRWFRRVPPGESNGVTRPTDTCPLNEGRAEVVHRVLTLENLTRPLRAQP
jgi:hypothetical protein